MTIYSTRHKQNNRIGVIGHVTMGEGYITCPYIPAITYPVKRLDRKMFYVLPETEWTHIEIKPKSALAYIDATKLVNTIQASCSRVDETKITDFGGGDFTIEMWVHK